MGHYYSEMVSDEELEQKAKARAKHLKEETKRVQEMLDKHGLAETLVRLTKKDYWF
jgi:hypothetical protein